VPTDDTLTLPVPLFVSVTAWAVLVVPTVREPKSSPPGVAETPTGGGSGGVGHGPQNVVAQPEFPPPSVIVNGTPQL
jgi:hypothetical protein